MMIVRTEDDRRLLQRTPHDFAAWSTSMGHKLSANKCFFMNSSRQNRKFSHALGGSQLEEREVMRDLGVLLSNELDYGVYVVSVVIRASRKSHGF